MVSKDNNAESDSEFLLMTKNDLTFAATDSLLADPNVWISDSGATSDTTVHEIGMPNKKMVSEEDNITDASGDNVSGKTVGDLKGIICNKQGKELYDATIKKLVYVPGSSFNLFSLSKRLENGWKMRGDANALWLEKDAYKIMFDIKIKIPKGALFCAYFKRKECATTAKNSGMQMSVRLAHDVSEQTAKVDSKITMKYLG